MALVGNQGLQQLRLQLVGWVDLHGKAPAEGFQSPHIRLEIKKHALQSLFLSGQLFQAGFWPMLAKSEYQRGTTALIRLYKLVCTDPYHDDVAAADVGEEWMSDDNVVASSGQMHPAVILSPYEL